MPTIETGRDFKPLTPAPVIVALNNDDDDNHHIVAIMLANIFTAIIWQIRRKSHKKSA